MSLEEFQNNRSPVKDFYSGKTILLTGGSGFLGKLLIEKCVKCGVKEILLVIRPKKGLTPAERLKKLLENEAIFMSYAEQPHLYTSKLRIVEGDISKVGLAIGSNDLAYIAANTNIIFHSAADVRFDESLRESVETNIRGTNELLKIAETCSKLEMFVHVSTAFSQCTQTNTEEKFYPPIVDPVQLMKLVETTQDVEEFEILSKKIIEPYPNTYAFTKSLAEAVVHGYGSKIPVTILRPSIVTSTWKDPIPGWTDNFYGFNGVVAGAGTGVLRIFHIRDENKADVIPVDIVVNATMLAVWYAVNHPEEPRIFNCTMEENTISWGQVSKECENLRGKLAAIRSLWIPTYNTTRYQLLASFLQIFYHIIPALFFDAMLQFRGEKPQVLRLYRKVHRFSDVLRFFTNRQFKFEMSRMRKAIDAMTIVDRHLFPCDMLSVDWGRFCRNHMIGCRTHLLHEPVDNHKEALQQYHRRLLIHRCMLAAIYSLLATALYQLLTCFGLPPFGHVLQCVTA